MRRQIFHHVIMNNHFLMFCNGTHAFQEVRLSSHHDLAGGITFSHRDGQI